MIKLGNVARDIVTGFTGTIIAKVEYLNGCIQFCLKPELVDGKMVPGEYFDSKQVEFVANGVAYLVDQRQTGGVMQDTPPERYS